MKLSDYHPFRSAEAKATFLAAYDARAQQWPIPSETTIVETSYGPTFVRISGPADGNPLVLLHGHSENGLNWLPNIADLSQTYRTYAVDIISDPGRSVYTQVMKRADDYTTWLDELLTGLGLKQGVDLIGLSYGGWLVSQYALRCPQRLRKVVLLAPGGISAYSLKFLAIAMPLSLVGFRIKGTFERLTRWIFKDFLERHDNTEEQFREWFDFIYLGLKSHKPQPTVFANVLTDEALQQLTMPTLFLTGENEIIYSVPKTLKRLRTVAPNIAIKVIPNAGHDLTFAQPQAVNHAILDFLDSSGLNFSGNESNG